MRRQPDGASCPGGGGAGETPLGYGRLLGLGSLLTSGLALAVLRPTPVHWSLLAAVVAVHLCVAWLSHALPRWTSSEWALLVFPVLAMLGLALTTIAAPGLAGVMVGYFVLCFAYTGLFLPDRGGAGAAWCRALVTYMVSLRGFNAQLAVRTCSWRACGWPWPTCSTGCAAARTSWWPSCTPTRTSIP